MISDRDCVLFDFDGTLVPNLDLPELRRQVVEMALPYGVGRPDLDRRLIVEGIEFTAEHLTASNQLDLARSFRDRAFAHVHDFEMRAARETRPFAGVREMLTRLREDGIATGVVTRNCDEAVALMFPDADDFLDVVLTRDRVEHLKPDPRHLEQALDSVGRGAATSVMVGDGRSDIEVGKKLDLYCVGVLTGSSSRAELEAAGADSVLEHVTELVTRGDRHGS